MSLRKRAKIVGADESAAVVSIERFTLRALPAVSSADTISAFTPDVSAMPLIRYCPSTPAVTRVFALLGSELRETATLELGSVLTDQGNRLAIGPVVARGLRCPYLPKAL